MIITHFNRDPRPGNYTFEQLFSSIREELSKVSEVVSYDLPTGLSPIQAIPWVKERAGSINHITGDVNFLAYGLPAKKTILTVHDLGHYTRTLRGLKKWVYRKFWLDGPFQKVALLTAISHFTKQELIEILGIPQEKIFVIPDPLLPGFSFAPKPFNTDRPTILQIGSGNNKNLKRLIKAVSGMQVRLLLINHLYETEVKAELITSGLDFEQRTDLDFEGLKKAYRDCDLLFFASEYEGFGMPILEAQATGRPVITSNLASMPEAAGKDGALFVDPFNVESIRKGIIDLMESKSLRNQLVTAGQQNVKKYELSTICSQYVQLYKSL